MRQILDCETAAKIGKICVSETKALENARVWLRDPRPMLTPVPIYCSCLPT